MKSWANAAQAERHLALFHKACSTPASLGEIPGEQALIALVDTMAAER
ncbi:MAG: hypothetical protein FWC72_06375 [Oscillospiraceae bacterium]|nr:hypothetical protein [Oscillospiraceae bacterium]